jgi:hypothetical protein
MRMAYFFTLQLLYYRSWVSRIKYTHGQPYYGTHTESRIMEHTESLFSVLKVVTHTHPTIPSMFIPPLKVDQAPKMYLCP